MKNIKKTLLIVVAMILMCAISAAVSLALYSATTNELENTFTFGSVSIKLDETDPDDPNKRVETGVEYDIDPGITYVKDPKITNTSDEKAWVRMTVTFNAAVAREFKILGDPRVKRLMFFDFRFFILFFSFGTVFVFHTQFPFCF